MLGVLLVLFFVWLALSAASFIVFSKVENPQTRESVFAVYLGATILTFLVIGGNW